MLQRAQVLPRLEADQGEQHGQAQDQHHGEEPQSPLNDEGTFFPADFKFRQGKTMVIAASPEHFTKSNKAFLITRYEFYHQKLRHLPVPLQF